MQSIITNFKNWLVLITDKPLHSEVAKYHKVSRVRYGEFWRYGQLNPLRREQDNPAWRNAQSIVDSFEEDTYEDVDNYDYDD